MELLRGPAPPPLPVVGVVDAGGPARAVRRALGDQGYETLAAITPGVTPQPRTTVYWRPQLTTLAAATAVAEAVGAADLTRIGTPERTPRPVQDTDAPVVVVVGEH